MRIIAMLFALGVLVGSPAWADDKHGGQEIQVGKYHVELVVKDRDLTLYVRDQADKPIDAKSVKATANVLSGKDKANVELTQTGDSLKAQLPFALQKDAKVLVTFSQGGGKSEQARFSLGQKQDHKGHKH